MTRFHVPAWITLLVFGAGYFAICSLIWGDPLSRLHGVEKLTGHHLWSWTIAPLSDRIERLTIEPLFVFGGYYGMAFIFAILALSSLPKEMRFWGGYALCMMAFYWFGSTSLSCYQPLPAAGRMTLPILPGLYIMASWFVAYKAIDLPRLSSRTGRRLTCGMLLGVAALPILPYLWSLQWEAPPEARAAGVIRQHVESQPECRFLLVCADVRSPESLAFYFDYRYPCNLNPVSIDDLDSTMLAGSDRMFLFLHEERSRFLHEAYGYTNHDRNIRDRSSTGMEAVYEREGVHVWLDGGVVE